jgi:diguanylate cyclase (GGDEF)-like protein/putative nucleotidyltransferase with HDIG domain
VKQLSAKAKLHISDILIVGFPLTVWQLSSLDSQRLHLLLATCGLASILQSIKIEGSTTRTSYNMSWVVYGFALYTLGVPGAMLIILVAHLVEWIWHGYAWYIQTFNIASFAIGITVAGFAFGLISTGQEPITLLDTVAIVISAALFTFLNHLMVGVAVKYARGLSLAQSGVLDTLMLSLDFGMLCLGAAGALIWPVNPYAIILVGLLAYLLQNVLRVPLLQRQSETDPKVDLYNSRYFASTVEKELERANRFNRPLAIVMADLDFLRRVNNIYGHLAGDAVLKGVAKILQDSSREFDTVARFGGEEFASLMPETTAEEALISVEAIRATVEKMEHTVATSVSPIKVTMSFGIASRNGRQISPEELIHRADLATFDAKQDGRNCARIYGNRVYKPGSSPSVKEKHQKQMGDASSASEPVREVIDVDGVDTRPDLPEVPVASPEPEQPVAVSGPSRLWLIKLYVGVVALIAITLVGLFVRPVENYDWVGLAAFAFLVILVEALAVEIYVKETSVSTSVAPLLAGVILFGPLAAVVLGLGVALIAFFRQRSQLDRLLFNSSNHIIGGLMAAVVILLSGQAFGDWPFPVQFILPILAMGIIYMSTTTLVAGAVSLNNRRPLNMIWNERFRWLGPYYLAMGIVAYALIVSYTDTELLGIVVIIVPLLLLRFSQKQYIDHTKALVAQLRRTNIKLTDQSEEISLLNDELLLVLARVADMRDPNVMEHSVNVARYGELIAREMHLSEGRILLVRQAGLLHDIGKLSVPDAILFKPGSLSDEEYSIVQGHVVTGTDLIQKCHSLRPLIPIIRHHHENFDGSGYPDNLAGERIPLEARILGLADAVDAMASDRPYRQAITPDDIEAEIRECEGSQFDPAVVEAFVRILRKRGTSVFANSAVNGQVRDLPGKNGQETTESNLNLAGKPTMAA